MYLKLLPPGIDTAATRLNEDDEWFPCHVTPRNAAVASGAISSVPHPPAGFTVPGTLFLIRIRVTLNVIVGLAMETLVSRETS